MTLWILGTLIRNDGRVVYHAVMQPNTIHPNASHVAEMETFVHEFSRAVGVGWEAHISVIIDLGFNGCELRPSDIDGNKAFLGDCATVAHARKNMGPRLRWR